MASIVKLISDLVNQKITAAFSQKKGLLHSQKPLISFTFDDFPASSYFQALPILDKYGIKATYYVAMGLEGRNMFNESLFSKEMVAELQRNGHEIASHTFNHLRCRDIKSDELRQDLNRNNQALTELTGEPVFSFSYPFGDLSVGSKKITGQLFTSSRGIQPGINAKVVDLNLLKANKIYSQLPLSSPLGLIRQNAERKGWLVFYTHDIKSNPSPYGCTPEYFEEVVKSAVESGAEIVTVRQASGFVTLK